MPRLDWQELQRVALALIGDYCELLAPIHLCLNLILKINYLVNSKFIKETNMRDSNQQNNAFNLFKFELLINQLSHQIFLKEPQRSPLNLEIKESKNKY